VSAVAFLAAGVFLAAAAASWAFLSFAVLIVINVKTPPTAKMARIIAEMIRIFFLLDIFTLYYSDGVYEAHPNNYTLYRYLCIAYASYQFFAKNSNLKYYLIIYIIKE
jgi:hypothetical protein